MCQRQFASPVKMYTEDERHIADIDEYTTNILEIIDNSIKASTNEYTNKKVNLKVLPGWNDEAKPFKENAMFWKCDMGFGWQTD